MSPNLSYTSLGFLLLSASAPFVAYCETYLNEDQAVKIIFPDETFVKKSIVLTPDEVKRIEVSSGQNVRSKDLTYWLGLSRNIVFIDQVLGKHEFITYAVGLTKQGQVQGVEILEYRESYGEQIKNESWRKQFTGKTKAAPLRVGADITNISGATLSSTHVTAGVKRILQTYDGIRERL